MNELIKIEKKDIGKLYLKQEKYIELTNSIYRNIVAQELEKMLGLNYEEYFEIENFIYQNLEFLKNYSGI